MASLFTPYDLIGAGAVKMRLAGSTDPLLDVGNVLTIKTDPQTRKVTVPNRRGGGGNALSKTFLSEFNLQVVFANLSSANMARVMGGTAATLPASTPTSEAHTATLGGFIPLGLLDSAVPVLVQDVGDTITYVAGTDYDLGHTGITPLAGGNISDADVLHISYGLVNHDVIQMFVNTGLEWEIHVDGINDADGSSYVAAFYRWTPPPSAFDFIGQDAAQLDATGEVLPDETKGSGESKFGRIEITSPA